MFYSFFAHTASKIKMDFICPVCKAPLIRQAKNYLCKNGHNFDIAKSGYVNLLLGSSPKNHGDNKLMAAARRDFLNKGYYASLKNILCETAARYIKEGGVLLDCGCGEGYYTAALHAHLPGSRLFGFDISKDALAIAAKRNQEIGFAVASSFAIPFADESVDMLFEIFSPYCGGEFRRVLKKNGVMLMVFPLENHLWELKCAVYDTPYKNEVAETQLDGFELLEKIEVKNRITIENSTGISNLFKMTPYYYKTGKKEQARAEKLESLQVQTEFGILVYQKK